MAISSRHKGWRYDSISDNLDIMFNGAPIGFVDSSQMTLIQLGVTGTAALSGAVSAAAALGVAGKVTYYDQLVHGNANVETITANTTLTISEVGKIIECDKTNISFTLPATVVGYQYTIVNTGADSTCSVVLTAISDDRIAGSNLVTTSGSPNKITNTAATHTRGDYVKVFGDGATGWYIMELVGTWAT